MADIDYDGYAPDVGYRAGGYAGAGRAGRLFNLIGGVVSLGLIAGIGYWSYELLARDVTGIPVVRAMEGPMRILPDDPGGERAAHQGLAVNRIAAEGEAAPPPERIVLAPRSADLAAEDLPQAVLRLTPGLTAAPPPRTATEEAVLEATTEVMTAEADIADEVYEIIPASVPGVTRSLIPPPRPRALAAVYVPAPDAEDANAVPAGASTLRAAPAEERDPSSFAAGTWLVQFDALGSPEEARLLWDRLAGRFGMLMAGKARVIEQGATGSETFYRLRAAGFTDLADARRFCAALVAEDSDCIPVVVR